MFLLLFFYYVGLEEEAVVKRDSPLPIITFDSNGWCFIKAHLPMNPQVQLNISSFFLRYVANSVEAKVLDNDPKEPHVPKLFFKLYALYYTDV